MHNEARTAVATPPFVLIFRHRTNLMGLAFDTNDAITITLRTLIIDRVNNVGTRGSSFPVCVLYQRKFRLFLFFLRRTRAGVLTFRLNDHLVCFFMMLSSRGCINGIITGVRDVEIKQDIERLNPHCSSLGIFVSSMCFVHLIHFVMIVLFKNNTWLIFTTL